MPKNQRFGQAALLNDREYAKLKSKLISRHHKLFLDIARWTGERWGAICQLRVGDVYLDPTRRQPREYITFRAQTRKRSKDGKAFTRQVPVHPSLAELLEGFQPIGGMYDYLFASPQDDAQPIGFSAMDKAFRRAVVAAGLSDKGLSTHSTRRTFITELSRRGAGIRTIQALTGHQDLRTLSKYIDETPDRLKAAISLL